MAKQRPSRKPAVTHQQPELVSDEKRYWKRPIHLHELGRQSGLVTEQAAKSFELTAEESGSGAKLSDWTTDIDLEAKAKEDSERIRKKRLGLK